VSQEAIHALDLCKTEEERELCRAAYITDVTAPAASSDAVRAAAAPAEYDVDLVVAGLFIPASARVPVPAPDAVASPGACAGAGAGCEEEQSMSLLGGPDLSDFAKSLVALGRLTSDDRIVGSFHLVCQTVHTNLPKISFPEMPAVTWLTLGKAHQRAAHPPGDGFKVFIALEGGNQQMSDLDFVKLKDVVLSLAVDAAVTVVKNVSWAQTHAALDFVATGADDSLGRNQYLRAHRGAAIVHLPDVAAFLAVFARALSLRMLKRCALVVTTYGGKGQYGALVEENVLLSGGDVFRAWSASVRAAYPGAGGDGAVTVLGPDAPLRPGLALADVYYAQRLMAGAAYAVHQKKADEEIGRGIPMARTAIGNIVLSLGLGITFVASARSDLGNMLLWDTRRLTAGWTERQNVGVNLGEGIVVAGDWARPSLMPETDARVDAAVVSLSLYNKSIQVGIDNNVAEGWDYKSKLRLGDPAAARGFVSIVFPLLGDMSRKRRWMTRAEVTVTGTFLSVPHMIDNAAGALDAVDVVVASDKLLVLGLAREAAPLLVLSQGRGSVPLARQAQAGARLSAVMSGKVANAVAVRDFGVSVAAVAHSEVKAAAEVIRSFAFAREVPGARGLRDSDILHLFVWGQGPLAYGQYRRDVLSAVPALDKLLEYVTTYSGASMRPFPEVSGILMALARGRELSDRIFRAFLAARDPSGFAATAQRHVAEATAARRAPRVPKERPRADDARNNRMKRRVQMAIADLFYEAGAAEVDGVSAATAAAKSDRPMGAGGDGGVAPVVARPGGKAARAVSLSERSDTRGSDAGPGGSGASPDKRPRHAGPSAAGSGGPGPGDRQPLARAGSGAGVSPRGVTFSAAAGGAARSGDALSRGGDRKPIARAGSGAGGSSHGVASSAGALGAARGSDALSRGVHREPLVRAGSGAGSTGGLAALAAAAARMTGGDVSGRDAGIDTLGPGPASGADSASGSDSDDVEVLASVVGGAAGAGAAGAGGGGAGSGGARRAAPPPPPAPPPPATAIEAFESAARAFWPRRAPVHHEVVNLRDVFCPFLQGHLPSPFREQAADIDWVVSVLYDMGVKYNIVYHDGFVFRNVH
jgi:hypothetical protein